ncbi:MAG TPA: glycosyltransferase family 2 protein [Bacteroidales bacterium]|nr:glycosyltransferase family 2 protein [Bacteroidales bacterium]
MKKIAVVILNWNGKSFLERFLNTLITNTDSELAEICIIDNNSKDDSVNYLKINYPNLKLIILDKNYGFAGGYNIGLKEIQAEYFLLLNSDIEVPKDWLNPLYEIMKSDTSIGICGPKLLNYNNHELFEYAGASGGFIDKYAYPFCRGRIFVHCEKDEGQYNDTTDCFWISGAAMMIRSDLFFKAGGFDEIFFAHQEEIDLCWRIQNLGYRVVIQPKSVVYHIGGGTLPKSNHYKTFLNFRNNLFIIEKNIPKYKRNKVKFVRLFADQIALYRMILQGRFAEAFSVIKAYFHFWYFSKQMSKQRKIIKPKSVKYLKGYYNHSIVKDYFLLKKKRFSDLNFDK